MNSTRTDTVVKELKSIFKKVSIKGSVDNPEGINAHVQTINTEQLAALASMDANLQVLLKRSGTGISIRFYLQSLNAVTG